MPKKPIPAEQSGEPDAQDGVGQESPAEPQSSTETTLEGIPPSELKEMLESLLGSGDNDLYAVFYKCGPNALFGFCSSDTMSYNDVYMITFRMAQYAAEASRSGPIKHVDAATEIVMFAALDDKPVFILINTATDRLNRLIQTFEDIYSDITESPPVHALHATMYDDRIGVSGFFDQTGYPVTGVAKDLQNLVSVKRMMERRSNCVLMPKPPRNPAKPRSRPAESTSEQRPARQGPA